MKIKCISLNLWLGGKLLDAILDFLEQENPDILLLQEAYNETDPHLERRFCSLQEIQKRCQFSSQDFAPSYREILPEGAFKRGNAILSKFPIVGTDIWWMCGDYGDYVDVPKNYPTAPRNLQHVRLQAGDSTLNVFNFQGVWDLNGENDSPWRLKMSRTIVDAAKGKPHVILGGDTNVRPNTKTIRGIERHLKNVFSNELKSTFNMRRKTNPGYATSVVDMFFVSPDIVVGDHRCPDVDISDHLPLVMTIEVAPQAPHNNQ